MPADFQLANLSLAQANLNFFCHLQKYLQLHLQKNGQKGLAGNCKQTDHIHVPGRVPPTPAMWQDLAAAYSAAAAGHAMPLLALPVRPAVQGFGQVFVPASRQVFLVLT